MTSFCSLFLIASSAAALKPTPLQLRRRLVIGGITCTTLFPTHAHAKDYPLTGDWVRTLASGPYYVLRQGGAEPPNSSPLLREQREGTYVCAACRTQLFASIEKFDSGTGWPSFAEGLKDVEVGGRWWASQLHVSTEVRCAGCGSHLGDFFVDGSVFAGTRAAVTGKRCCIDGAALCFLPNDGGAQVSGDGLTQRRTVDGMMAISPPLLRLPRVAARAS